MPTPVRESHANTFDFIRFVAATLVVFSHCFPLSGGQEPLEPVTGWLSFGTLGVLSFFAISGMLVTASWERDPAPLRFLRKRALRLFPGLIVAVLWTVLVVGPLVTLLSARDYFLLPETWRYLRTLIFYPIGYDLPGVFVGNPIQLTINGSLWSLPVEAGCYLVVLALCALRVLRPVWGASLVLLAVLIFGWPYTAEGVVVRGPIANGAVVDVRCLAAFFAGMLWQTQRGRVPSSGWIALLLVVLDLALIRTRAGQFLLAVTLPYLLDWLAHRPNAWLEGWSRRFGDLSYGIYIYGFVVQQVIMFYFEPSVGVPAFFAASLLVTLGLAALSWHFVEAPALKLKHVRFRLPQWRWVTPAVSPSVFRGR